MAQTAPIETDRLVLEPFGEHRLSAEYVGWLNDPAVVRYSEQRHRRHTLQSCRDYWLSFAGTPHFFWAIVAKDPALGHIGNMNGYLDESNATVDLGILIGAKEAWGRGYGSEAWMAACDHLFRAYGIRKLTAGTLAVNAGMLHIMDKAGMRSDGTRLRQCLVEGKETDMVYRALFRDEWLAGAVG
jgi:[ribosomal protein S5]-alanine N-acetyltransferase